MNAALTQVNLRWDFKSLNDASLVNTCRVHIIHNNKRRKDTGCGLLGSLAMETQTSDELTSHFPLCDFSAQLLLWHASCPGVVGITVTAVVVVVSTPESTATIMFGY